MSRQRIVSYRVEGIGLDASQSVAADWQYRGDTDHGRAALAGLPRGAISDFVDPVAGTVQFAAFTPTLRYGTQDPDTDGQAATTFKHRERDGVGELSADLDRTSTDVGLPVSGLDGQVVHINTEAIRLGNYESSYDGQGNPGYSGCSRDYWGIDGGLGARAHEAGAVAYPAQPYWRGRIIELHLLDDGVASNPEWLGIIRDAKTANQGTQIRLECDALWSVWLARTLGGETGLIEPRNHRLTWTLHRELSVGEYIRSEYESAVMKPDDWTYSDRGVAVQVEGGLYVLYANGGRPPLLESKPPADEGRRSVEAPAREVCVFGQYFEDYVDNLPFSTNDPPIPTWPCEYPHHPVQIADAMLSSTSWATGEEPGASDVLRGPWGLGVRGTRIQTIDLTPTAHMRADHLVYGWDGEKVEPRELLAFLRRWGWMAAPASDGTLKYARWGIPTVQDYADASPLDPLPGTQFDWDKAYDEDVAAAEATIGAMPWREGRPVDIEVTGRPHPDWEDGKTVELEFPEVAKENVEVAGALLTSFVQRHKDGYDLLTCKAQDPSQLPNVSSWEALDWVVLQSVPPKEDWAVEDAERVPVDGGAQWIGQIWGVDHPVAGGAYTLTIALPRKQIIRERAAGMEVVGSDYGGSAVTVYTDSSSNFGWISPDNQAFFVGDEIRFHNVDGSLHHSTVYQIADIGSDGTGPFLLLDSTLQADPTGAFAQPADFDAYANTNNGLDGIDRVWMFLADNDHTLGSADADGDIYGR